MPKQTITVNHTCGCTRRYEIADVPPHMQARMVVTLEHQTCGACKGAPRRLLAKHAQPEGNGHRPEAGR